MEKTRPVVLGRVVGAHGLRGEIRVRFLGDGPENLLAASQLMLAADSGGCGARTLEVERRARGRPGEVRLGLRGVADRDAAEALQGRWVLARAADLAPLPAGEWYWHEVIGCRVEAEDGGAIGVVREIWETGAHDVLVVEGDDGERRLLPAAEGLLKEVDIEGRRIVVEVIEGLLDPV